MADQSSELRQARKRKKKQYCGHMAKHGKKAHFVLQPGQKGFLCTCNKDEKRCVREAYVILNEYADVMFGPENESQSAEEKTTEEKTAEEKTTEEKAAEVAEVEDDVMDDLDSELSSLRDATVQPCKKRRFQCVDSRVKNCVFIKTTVEDPLTLAYKIFSDVETTKQQKSRFLIRMIPVEITCRAEEDDVAKAAEKLFDKHMKDKEKTFSILFKARNNDRLSRTNIIPLLANLAKQKNVLNRPDLRNPQVTILVEVIQKVCCLSVVENYSRFCKYNLIEVASAKTNSEKTTEAESVSSLENAAAESGAIEENPDKSLPYMVVKLEENVT